MNKSLRVRARRISDAIFSSMFFGGLFGTWVLVTGVVAFNKGWPFVWYSVAGYLVLWISVAIAGWFLEDKSAA